ncbi:hypothetical protein C3L33_01948, partial [Rhododendron williamsianum]
MLLTPPFPPEKAAGDHHRQWRLYSVTSGKLLNFDQLKMVARPPPYQRFCGSSYGWLGAENKDSSITFFNPFSGKCVRFPPAHPCPPQINRWDPVWANYLVHQPVVKFFCSSDPNNFELSDGDFVIGAIFGSYNDFAYIKPGSSDWTYISSTRPRPFTDAVYHLGKFYLVDNYCCVTSVDVSTGGIGSDTTTSEAKPPHVEVVVPPIDSYNRRVYLVVSSGGGDLLLVHALRHPTRWQTIGQGGTGEPECVDMANDSNNQVLVSQRRRPPSSPDWASLPSGILDLILDHLIQVVDYLRFSTVCKPWLSAALYQKDRRRKESIIHNQSVPMLLTPPLPPKKAAGDHHRRWRLYSVTSGKLLNWDQLKMVARRPPNQRLCGSSYGWLGAVNEDSSITFFNPFSGTCVRFPRAHPCPPQINLRDPLWENYLFEKQVLKFVCSSDPNNFELFDGDFVIGTIFGSYDDFAYIKPGSSGWTYISSTRPRGFTDAVYHLGKFYLVDNYCCVTSVDVSTGGTGRDTTTTTTEAKPPHVEVVIPPTDSCNGRVYLVVSSGGGDLLLVHAIPHPTRWQTT